MFVMFVSVEKGAWTVQNEGRLFLIKMKYVAVLKTKYSNQRYATERLLI